MLRKWNWTRPCCGYEEVPVWRQLFVRKMFQVFLKLKHFRIWSFKSKHAKLWDTKNKPDLQSIKELFNELSENKNGKKKTDPINSLALRNNRHSVVLWSRNATKTSKRKNREKCCPTFKLGMIRSGINQQVIHPSIRWKELNYTRRDRELKGCPREYPHIHMGVHEDIWKKGGRRETVVTPMEQDAVYLEMKNRNWVTKNVHS
jgi:hypothetical protein